MAKKVTRHGRNVIKNDKANVSALFVNLRLSTSFWRFLVCNTLDPPTPAKLIFFNCCLICLKIDPYITQIDVNVRRFMTL